MTDESKGLLRQKLREYIRRNYIPEPAPRTEIDAVCYSAPVAPELPEDAFFAPAEDFSIGSTAENASFSHADEEFDAVSAPREANRREDDMPDPCAYFAPGAPAAAEHRKKSVSSPMPKAAVKRKVGLSSLFGSFTSYELDESFGEAVRRLIKEKNLSKGDFYARANVNSAWLSNVAKNNVTPKKEQALACCIGLRLNPEETRDLLEKAGYTLSNSNLRDVIVKFFIENGRYDIDELNEELYNYDLVPLGQNMK